MNREYHKWYSPSLHREMELLIFGHGGAPVLVFPTSKGRFFEYEDRGMIEAARWKYDGGGQMAVCVDSVDAESWYNREAHPRDRALRHAHYDLYLTTEVLPLIRTRTGGPLTTTGCSFGGYHAVNYALRHPDLVSGCVSMSGAFDIKQFLDGYYDDNCYYNNPVDFVPGMTDSWYLDQYRRMRIVLATGERDICLGENRRMSGLLSAKDVPHWLDVWGNGTAHDWPWWREMVQKFL
ncbi:MAG: esterase family protein [Acidobacteria bacterium]|nr:esterase family protein [Acidobacteriota bacterium]